MRVPTLQYYTGEFQIAGKPHRGSIHHCKLPLETQSIPSFETNYEYLQDSPNQFGITKAGVSSSPNQFHIHLLVTCCHKHSETKLTSSALPRKTWTCKNDAMRCIKDLIARTRAKVNLRSWANHRMSDACCRQTASLWLDVELPIPTTWKTTDLQRAIQTASECDDLHQHTGHDLGTWFPCTICASWTVATAGYLLTGFLRQPSKKFLVNDEGEWRLVHSTFWKWNHITSLTLVNCSPVPKTTAE